MSERSAHQYAWGGCLCGGVRFTVRGPLRDVLECHCRRCRRFTGGLWHATAARREHVVLEADDSLRWHSATPGAHRGFCGACGCGLFLDMADRPTLVLAASALEPPTGLRLAARIWTQQRGDYYTPGVHAPEGADLARAVNDPVRWQTGRVMGACMCGGVQYGLEGPLREVVACHCSVCRRFTGGLWHATAAHREHLTIHDEGTLAWYQSSPDARRGFCSRCGASLFMEPAARPVIATSAGTLHAPTGLRLAVRIHTADGADFDIPGGDIPSYPDEEHGLTVPEA